MQHLRSPAEVLDVVVGHRRALGVTDNVDLARVRRREDLIDERRQLCRALLHRREPAELVARWARARVVAVRQREHAVAVVREQRRHRLPVVGHVGEQAVDEHDRARVCPAGSARPVVRAGWRRSLLGRARDHVGREEVRHRVLLGRVGHGRHHRHAEGCRDEHRDELGGTHTTHGGSASPSGPARPSGGITPRYGAVCPGRGRPSGLALLGREDRAVRPRRRHQARARIVPRPARGLAADQLLAVG